MVAKCDCGQVPAELFGRRDFIRIGSLGMFGLGLRDLFAMQALANETPARSALKAGAPDRSVILVWLSGGPPHMDTFDMKPDGPKETRGTFKPIPTNVSGIQVCEHMPYTAKQADKYAIMRQPGQFHAYKIVAFSGVRGAPPRLVDDRLHGDINAAYHAVFLLRVNDLMES